MIRVWDLPLMTLQLTTFVPWKRFNSSIHPIIQYYETMPTPPGAPPVLAGQAVEQTILQPSRFRQYAVLVGTMRSKPSSPTNWTTCASPNPLPSHMLIILMVSLGVRGGQRHVGGGAKWSG